MAVDALMPCIATSAVDYMGWTGYGPHGERFQLCAPSQRQILINDVKCKYIFLRINII